MPPSINNIITNITTLPALIMLLKALLFVLASPLLLCLKKTQLSSIHRLNSRLKVRRLYL
jgi:hypothetical protein